jgi:putative acetyltransferase
MSVLVRPYRPEDRTHAALIYWRAIMEGSTHYLTEAERLAWAVSPEPDRTEPDKLLDQWCWIAEEDGRPTGFMSLCHDGLLDMAFVLPEARRGGTAAALYDTLQAKARAEGLTRLTVVASEMSQRFLSRRGWTVDHEGPETIDGQTYHLAHMSLDLSGA